MSANRLDAALVERGLCESRETAQRAIMAGQVSVNGLPAHPQTLRNRTFG
jgi:predicted rRNA methylase YqxC with S4 and FtsJ domains